MDNCNARSRGCASWRIPMRHDSSNPLSPHGVERREAILAAALRAAGRRRARRRAGRAAGAFAVVVVGLLAITALVPRSTPVSDPRAPSGSFVQTTVPLPRVVITHIETDPTLSRKLALPPQEPRWRRIGDAELLQAFADAGKSAGLAYVNGEAVLVYH